jgi:hypothetical protein
MLGVIMGMIVGLLVLRGIVFPLIDWLLGEH